MAGWDDFLTDQDKQHLALFNEIYRFRAKGKRYHEGRRPAVLVIDVYYAALGHERKPLLDSLRQWPLSCGLEGWAAVDRTAPLLAAARAAAVPVLYVRRLPGFPGDASRESGGDLPPELRAMSNEIVREIAPQPGDWVFGKTAPSAFANTPLLHHLRTLDVDTLIVCGEATSGCVRATVVDAASLRYHVAVVGECCFDRTQASHWINLFDMSQKYADLIDVKSATDYFRTLRGKSLLE